MFLPRKILENRLLTMLAEDLGQGDITTAMIVPPESEAEAAILSREEGVAAGVEEARILLQSLGLTVKTLVEDGQRIRPKQTLIGISGNTRTILSTERTVLNIISRMSGIATKTQRLVDALRKAKLKTQMACTRKTAPGLLYFDKKAVHIGGADTHRLHLDDMILIKDNHVKIAGNIQNAVRAARKKASFSKKIEVEISKPEDVTKAVGAGADIIMYDNFSPDQVREAMELLRKSGNSHILSEASGGITSKNLLAYASAGVDILSSGEITDSASALDMSLEIVKVRKTS
jgi:nicotinate-nucleotide pyrophosphorylase (carboxylating)